MNERKCDLIFRIHRIRFYTTGLRFTVDSSVSSASRVTNIVCPFFFLHLSNKLCMSSWTLALVFLSCVQFNRNRLSSFVCRWVCVNVSLFTSRCVYVFFFFSFQKPVTRVSRALSQYFIALFCWALAVFEMQCKRQINSKVFAFRWRRRRRRMCEVNRITVVEG